MCSAFKIQIKCMIRSLISRLEDTITLNMMGTVYVIQDPGFRIPRSEKFGSQNSRSEIKLEPRNLDPRNLEPRNLEPRNLDPRNLDPRNLDPRYLDPKNLGRRKTAWS